MSHAKEIQRLRKEDPSRRDGAPVRYSEVCRIPTRGLAQRMEALLITSKGTGDKTVTIDERGSKYLTNLGRTNSEGPQL